MTLLYWFWLILNAACLGCVISAVRWRRRGVPFDAFDVAAFWLLVISTLGLVVES